MCKEGFRCDKQAQPAHYGPAGINKDAPDTPEGQRMTDSGETLHQVARILATRHTALLLSQFPQGRLKWIWDELQRMDAERRRLLEERMMRK